MRPGGPAEGHIVKATRANLLFAGLKQSELKTVIDAMFEVKIAGGQVVITEGDKAADNFYVVQDGEFEAFVKEKKVKSYTTDDAFGELALLYNTPRAATVKCTKAGTLWALDRVTFRRVLVNSEQGAFKQGEKFLRGLNLFSSLKKNQIALLASAVNQVSFQDGQVICKEGDNNADTIYFVQSGTLNCSKNGKPLETLTTGDVFGEAALEENPVPRQATVVAEGVSTICLMLTGDQFHELLGPSLASVVSKNYTQKILSSVTFDNTSLSSILSNSEMNHLLDSMPTENFSEGSYIFKEGDMGDKFYVIKNGKVEVSSKAKGKIANLEEGQYFGEVALLKDEPRMATVMCVSNVICLSLNRSTFSEHLGPLQDRLNRDMARRINDNVEDRLIKFEELEIKQVLGVGSFGQVRLVVHNKQGTKPYALKGLYKGQIIAMNQVTHIISEKDMLLKCNHPFLLKLYGAYQDKDMLYLLLELVLGGELFSLLSQQGGFSESGGAFYVSNVVAAFEYLHDRNIVYRDLKPENLLVDAQGYLKVVDFGFAKVVEEKTWTLCGTPDYLAPEIILNKGHNYCADVWATGVLAFELMAGYPPFGDLQDPDPMKTYRNIIEGKFSFPKHFSRVSRQFIEAILKLKPEQRMGCGRDGATQTKAHAYFKNINWLSLEKKEIAAPWVPDIKNPMDTSNFEQNWDIPLNEYADHNSKDKANLFDNDFTRVSNFK